MTISRRDDLESLGYNLIYFMKGHLPLDTSDYDKLKFIKSKISLDKLCEGLPYEFKEFIKYAKQLEFKEKLDYKYLKNLLLNTAKNNNIDINCVKYDWEIKEEEIISK